MTASHRLLHVAGVLSASRVLVVDDDVEFAESVAEILESSQFSVATAWDATSALARVEAFQPHVALIDVRLGPDNGAELVARLRERLPELVCILMTAYAALDTAILALQRKADDYLLKPLQPKGMLELVRTSVERARETLQSQRRERLERLGTLAAGTAHDLNNMLMVVLSETEDLEQKVDERPASETVRAGLRLINEATQRAVQLTRHLLIFARGTPSESPCLDSHAVLEEVAAIVGRSLPSGVALDVDLTAETVPLPLEAEQLYRVILNLLVNARESVTPPGALSLQSRTSDNPYPAAAALPSDERRSGLLVTVTDSGTGIEPSALQEIFEPFFTTKAAGSGLGLSIAYGIVQASGGDIFVESKLGVGTRFEVWIPHLPQLAQAAGAIAPTANDGRPGVLVCDDDLLVLNSLTRVLSSQGYEVTRASSVDEALAIWHADPQRFSVLVADIRVGQQLGTDLARALRAERPDLRILFISGTLGAADSLGLAVDRITYLVKPFTRQELTAAMRKIGLEPPVVR